ncbi:hypothetical protein BCR43DRAFT_492858 [Syncephalastrum racemosum]|uniref:P-loop containing nucleoside triphosphate hydrolase protein n=1 Tax=Syncephalastrum racemosum TaxID=13706 RepID=A0A1X2H9P4_SYNRA|nr:hypothetical protein BCR43DRAFT_492858 [Syncephalastrum racemosum]
MVFDGFDAAVDWPEVAFLEQLMEKYPDAKVILTERSADSWYTSVKNTIYKFAKEKLVPDDAPQHIKDNTAMINTIVLDGAFGDKPGLFEDEALMKQKFLEHNAWVKANVPADRLLVMQTTELNWEALCGFLGKDVPDEPFPRSNSTAEIKEKAAEIMKKGFENVGSVLKGSA